ncbi:optineurin-like [Nerophis ophidion]|uniref:optineurin-like n=1 Tax=Nerophis ophidion TaxID=159077 RepID=UPI002ADF9C73|nr:optineurin-like [Nerophis ophidion]
MMNGDTSSGVDTLEETLQQMNVLIQENKDLKESLHKTNLLMKERLESLSTWRDKQREEHQLMVTRLEEAGLQMEALTLQNQELSQKLEEAGDASQVARPSAEADALRAQLARLQAEKNDLVALNSELQLKADHNSHEDSFIEVIKVSDQGVVSKCPDSDADTSEEVTVSQLLASLRKETQRAERLQGELQAAVDKNTALEESRSLVTVATQTSMTSETREDSGKDKAASQLESMKCGMKTLVERLQQAQSELDDAEGMKKNLQDSCHLLEQRVDTLRAQLEDKQAVQAENHRLKLQLDSMQTHTLMEQRKAGEERSNLAQLKDAYTQLFEDYNELQEEKKKRELVDSRVLQDLQGQLTAAEQALVDKQENIDSLKQEIFQKEKELETISVLQAQAEVYSSDFYAERAAREKLHEERERLSAQLEYVKKQNCHLQELDTMRRLTLSEMQRKHLAKPNGRNPALVGRGTDWQHQGNIPENVCPKCNSILPDLDSLQIHIMDCIN